MSVYIEINEQFIPADSGGLLLVLDYEAVKSSIDNILRTSKGERVMLPEFGSGLGNILFDTIDANIADSLADEIKEAINTWDPRVIVKSINIKPDVDQHYMGVFIEFQIAGITTPYTYSGTLNQ